MSVSLVKSDKMPSGDQWLAEAKADPGAEKIGMYLTHNGVVRKDAKAKVRAGADDTQPVTGMYFSYDEAGVEAAIEKTYKMPGIYYIRCGWQQESLAWVTALCRSLSVAISGRMSLTGCSFWSARSKMNVSSSRKNTKNSENRVIAEPRRKIRGSFL